MALIRFAVRAVRVSASTIAVVALLRQEWVAAGAFAVAWFLILGRPGCFPCCRIPPRLHERSLPFSASGTQQRCAFQPLLAGIASLQTLADHAGQIVGVVGDTAEPA